VKADPTNIMDQVWKDPANMLVGSAPQCFAKAGDCATAFKAYKDLEKEINLAHPMPAVSGTTPWWQNETILRSNFETSVPACKGK
jgi:hypothetical protein